MTTGERLSLVTLQSADGLPDHAPVDAIGYSRFKHGDTVAARRFGMALAALAAGQIDGRSVLVTTSAFAKVPPAAHSLLAPFVQQLRLLRPDVEIGVFRIARRGVSNGDYSRMTIADRRDAIGAGDLTPEQELTGAFVLALDDIRVTGNHERAMDRCLTVAGVSTVWHLYVVDAAGFAASPQIESVLNEAAIRDVDDLLEIASGRRFVPNARLCRRVLSLPLEQLRIFVQQADPSLLAWLTAAIEHDGLAGVPAYARRVQSWDVLRDELAPYSGAGVS